jgi:hypothetical protein
VGGEKKAVEELVCARGEVTLKWLGIRKVSGGRQSQTPSPTLQHSPLRILDSQPHYLSLQSLPLSLATILAVTSLLVSAQWTNLYRSDGSVDIEVLKMEDAHSTAHVIEPFNTT